MATAVEFAEAPFEIIDGDRGKNYPKQGEFLDSGHCLFLSATNVTKTGFDFAMADEAEALEALHEASKEG